MDEKDEWELSTEEIEYLARNAELALDYFEKLKPQIPEILDRLKVVITGHSPHPSREEMVENISSTLPSDKFFKETEAEELISDYYDETYSNMRGYYTGDEEAIRDYAVELCNYMILSLSMGAVEIEGIDI